LESGIVHFIFHFPVVSCPCLRRALNLTRGWQEKGGQEKVLGSQFALFAWQKVPGAARFPAGLFLLPLPASLSIFNPY
jgi:hypothetical protein